jgi:ubiquinol-cytochrome c reductase iron-sulfur subunit
VSEAKPEAAHGDDATRRDFIYIAAGATGAVGAVMTVWPFIDQMNPAADTLSLASTEVNLASMTDGQLIKPLWRGKPVFVLKRTAEQIALAQKDDSAPDLKDPQKDVDRIKQSNGNPGKPEYLIIQANCTHLGCVPDYGRGDYGGWFCPCHGSQFDTSGRIRKGPAPTNLPPAPYVFVSDTVIKIG